MNKIDHIQVDYDESISVMSHSIKDLTHLGRHYTSVRVTRQANFVRMRGRIDSGIPPWLHAGHATLSCRGRGGGT